MKSILNLTVPLVLAVTLCAQGETDSKPAQTPKAENPYVLMKTSMGDITIELFRDQAPKTVANFIGLAEGTKEFTDASTGEKKKGHYYDGLMFHRIIPKFMAQGGCPLGTGTGSPGYAYDGECDRNVKHDRPGLLSMANAGPGTDGSQFFITFVPTAWLDGKHTIFGEVVEGMDTLKKLEGQGTPGQGRPKSPLKIEKAKIIVE